MVEPRGLYLLCLPIAYLTNVMVQKNILVIFT